MGMPRVQSIVLPILRKALPDVNVRSWGEDIDYRMLPAINVRRVGGVRNKSQPMRLDLAVVEMTAYGNVGLPETELLYIHALEALYEATRNQTQTDAGYLHSIKETMGMTQFSSSMMDSWRVQGLIQLGVRPRSNQLTRST